ncbi:MAG TPA: hypothetical protein VEU08_15995, partial [Vicinamibacterales bacterium]|nr:hypothetical protein [Vicinamibacterales bacterium]
DVTIPQGLVVNQVDGPTVADWDATGQRLRVRLLEPAAAEASFVVSGEARTPREGSMAVPLVRVPSAERETGGVAADGAGASEIGGRQARGLDPADPSELGDVVAGRDSPSMIAFRDRPSSGTDPRSLTVSVVRYTPQAVLVANVEEARYRVLASEDGRLLVQARYAVRNNQRSFLKATLPAGSTVWSASVNGRPIRPGVAEANAVLLPLDKSFRRGGSDEAPSFVIELTYAQPIAAWTDGGSARIDLPAVDLPVSRTGVELHYSPRFKVTPEPGAFRIAEDTGPVAEAFRESSLRDDNARTAGTPVAAAPPPAAQPVAVSGAAAGGLTAQQAMNALVNRFKNEAGGRTVVGSLPVAVAFPPFGQQVFLASELTAESTAPSIPLTIKRTGHAW